MESPKQAILHTLRVNKERLQKRYPIHAMALFGSQARGDQTAESDIDILVDVDPAIGLHFVELAEDLERLLGQKVDLISKRAIKINRMEAIQQDLIDV